MKPNTLPRSGFEIKVLFYTQEAEEKVRDPETLRNLVGFMLDELAIQEEIDYTVEVSRIHYP